MTTTKSIGISVFVATCLVMIAFAANPPSPSATMSPTQPSTRSSTQPLTQPFGESGKPRIKVAADGFPTGQDTPEGAACDLARAFINRDTSLFTNTCIRLYVDGKGPEDYAKFLQSTIEGMKKEAAKTQPSAGGPKSIGKVFAARHLSQNGPASTGYAMFDFQDIMFVDVGAFLQNGKRALNRTLVIKDSDGKWYAHPLPTAGSGLLGTGLNDETESKKDFTEVYDVQK